MPWIMNGEYITYTLKQNVRLPIFFANLAIFLLWFEKIIYITLGVYS